MRRGELQNINPQNYQQRKKRLVDGIFVSRKKADQSQKITPVPQPKKIISQPSKTYQPSFLKKPELKSSKQPKTYQFESPKTTRMPKASNEPSFFEIPLAQEYEKDWAEKSAIYKRFAITGSFVVILLSLVLSGIFLFKKQAGISEKVYAESNAGKNSLLAAQNFLINLDFANAEKSFTLAFEDFKKIEKELSSLGQSNILVGKVPNNDSIVLQGEKLVAVAKNISFAGKEIASCASLFENFDILSGEKIESWQNFNITNERILRADTALLDAQNNLSYVNPKILPEIAELVSELKDSLPIAREVLSLLKNVTSEGAAILGKEKAQDYLILFQNPAEARATGGFLGNYGYLSFNKGKLIGPRVEDIYKLKWLTQGKRDLIKPPEEIYQAKIEFWQKASMEIWDANWDIDFPTAAKKIEWYYEQYDQGLVEGVIACDPIVFADILKIIGPIKMNKYKVTVNAKNFWKVMEEKVEIDNSFKRGKAKYKDANPKQILKDFAPRFMAKIKKATDNQRHQIIKSIYENIKRKHLLLFSNNQNLQGVFEKLNWSGKVQSISGDYVYVNESNVGVNKSSSRIKQDFELQVDIKEDKIQNKLKITRKHQGKTGSKLSGRNIAYLRILVPKGATLNSFLIDGKDVARRVLLLEEAGKTKFGILTRLKPQKTQIIEIAYTLPFKLQPTSITPKYYSLYFQKQPGRINDKIDVNINIDPGLKIESIESEKGGNFTSGKVEFTSDLLEDRIFNLLLAK